MAESLNIKYRSEDWRGSILSNPADTPFRIGEIIFKSVESALQGIKKRDTKEQNIIFGLDGMSALREGRKITDSIVAGEEYFVYWDGQSILYNSTEHRLLIAMFIGEKVRQNKIVQQALLETWGTFIFHDVGQESPNTSLPEKFYIEILLSQRKLLRKLLKI